jgi:NADH-quinone oxidoreductase subunit G
MNRCIQCYRCVRYYKDYAGGTDFGVFGSHNQLYFGRFEDGALESEFSGNLVEVCPTGVFTDKTLKKHYTRKWDLTNAPSICTHCAVGCNTIIGERYGEIRRTLNRYNADVNGYFLCDRGRFGYEFVNDAEMRIRQSIYKATKTTKVPINFTDAIQRANYILSTGKTIGIGSPTASLESNFALKKLVGKENFYAGIDSNEFSLLKEIQNIYQSGKIHVPSLLEIEKTEAVLILGEDILQTAPRLALTVRQSVKNKPMAIATKLNIPDWNNIAAKNAIVDAKGPLFIATPANTKIDDIATLTIRKEATGIIQFAQAITACLKNENTSNDISSEIKQISQQVAEILKTCKSITVISGTQLANKELIETSLNVALSLISDERKVGLYFVVPECNSLGLSILSEKNLDNALETISKSDVDNVVILENNLYKRTNSENIKAAFIKVKNIMVLDHSKSEISNDADLLLASGTFAESEGTLINSEGRMQRYFSALPAKDEIHQSWKWLSEIYSLRNGSIKQNFDSIVNEISTEFPLLTAIEQVAPAADYRENGMKVPRETPRFSGRGAILARINVSEPMPPQDENSALAYSMEGSKAIPPAELTSFYWAPGWNSVQASNKYLKELNNALNAKGTGIRIFK